MTSSNGNIFRVTGPLCGEFTGDWWIPRKKIHWRGAVMFSLICAWINCWVNNREAGDLIRHRTHYHVTVMFEMFKTSTVDHQWNICPPWNMRWHASSNVCKILTLMFCPQNSISARIPPNPQDYFTGEEGDCLTRGGRVWPVNAVTGLYQREAKNKTKNQLKRLFRRRSKKTSQLRVTGLCAGNSQHKGPVTWKMFPFDDVVMEWAVVVAFFWYCCPVFNRSLCDVKQSALGRDMYVATLRHWIWCHAFTSYMWQIRSVCTSL